MDPEASSATTTTESSPRPAERAAAPAVRPSRPTETQTIHHGSVTAEPDRSAAPVVTIKSAAPQGRSFTEHQRTMLANLDAHGDVAGPEKTDSPPAAPAVAAAVTNPPVTPAPGAAAAVPVPSDVDARATRLAEHNKRLVAEVEQLRTSRGAPEPDDRMKALDEIEQLTTTDPWQAIRRLVALNAGIKDHASADLDPYMRGIYSQWTARELKVPMDAGEEAKIESARNRLLIDRDKRERETAAQRAEAKAKADAETAHHDTVGRQLDSHLETAKHADKYPLLMKHAKTFDRMTPGALVYGAIRRGVRAGEFAPETPDDVLINHYSKEIETHYQALRDEIAGAAQTSTAPTTQATVPVTTPPASAPQPGARTITNASASAAPATPPTAPPAEKPRRESEEARRRRLAATHFPD